MSKFEYAVSLLAVFLVAQHAKIVLGALLQGCPDPNDILPCLCYNSPITILKCQNIMDQDTLQNVFIHARKHRLKEVHIEYSAFQFIPFDTFKDVEVSELHLRNVTMVQLFDETPENLEQLEVLHIENSDIFGGIAWEFLKPFTHLRVLTIFFGSIPYLDTDFSEHVSHNLKQLSFHATETSEIGVGVFKEFVNLDKVEMNYCELTKLSRDMFPVPFNVRQLYFHNNHLRYISDDFFTNMPNLQTVGLRNNRIAAFPGTSSEGTFSKVGFFILEGNPIICDCRLKWLINKKPDYLTGSCADPDELRGKELKSITVADLKCTEYQTTTVSA